MGNAQGGGGGAAASDADGGAGYAVKGGRRGPGRNQRVHPREFDDPAGDGSGCGSVISTAQRQRSPGRTPRGGG